MYDVDGNGSINREEMSQVLKSIMALTGDAQDELKIEESVDNYFREMDSDQNGEISKAEFLAGAKNDKSLIQAISVFDGIA